MIAGAGPAGIAAACAASETGAGVALLDDNPEPGGQIWRHDQTHRPSPVAQAWLERLQRSSAVYLGQSRIVSAHDRLLTVEQTDGALEVEYRKLILATGARERFLPFPGWTLPGVVGAGALQALVKSGLPVGGRCVAVAGSGPLLFAAAAHLKRAGARIQAIIEQAPLAGLLRFAAHLVRYGRSGQALGLGLDLAGVPLHTSSWVEAAEGRERVQAIRVRTERGIRSYTCDYLATGYGLEPNVELACLLGCELDRGFVAVHGAQATTVDGVYAAGEITGIGGVDSALAEGAAAASGSAARVQRWTGFKRLLENTFALRDELRSLAAGDTIVCRCEDVRLGALDQFQSWREAKLQSRCGMGPCQGRVCGPALEFLKRWSCTGVRPPVLPARAGTLSRGYPALPR